MEISTSVPALTHRLLDAAVQRGVRQKAAPAPEEVSFSGALGRALGAVSAQQHEASRMIDAFQSDPTGQSLEQTMVTLQKAQIGFQSALHIRNRLVAAYSDIMNMQV